MPSRMIREGWITSDRVSKLDAEAECFFLRLCLVADDYGRFDGRPEILRARLFPLSAVDCQAIVRQLTLCQQAGVVLRYEVGGKPFVHIPGFNQRLRKMKSDYPPPPLSRNAGHTPDNCRREEKEDLLRDLPEEKRRKEKDIPLREIWTIFDDQEFRSAWKEHYQIRKSRKGSLSLRADSQLLRKLKDLSNGDKQQAIAILHQAADHGWISVFPLKDCPRGGNNRLVI